MPDARAAKRALEDKEGLPRLHHLPGGALQMHGSEMLPGPGSLRISLVLALHFICESYFVELHLILFHYIRSIFVNQNMHCIELASYSSYSSYSNTDRLHFRRFIILTKKVRGGFGKRPDFFRFSSSSEPFPKSI